MPNPGTTFAVVGAGHGGQATAGYLANSGFSVRLLNKSRERIRPVKDAGGISLEGVINGFAPIDVITTDPAEAVPDADVLMVVVPANAHASVAGWLAPYLTENHTIVLNPGRTGGALEFRHVLSQMTDLADTVRIAESQTFLFASRVTGPARVTIYGVKRQVALAALPARLTPEVLDAVGGAFPQFVPGESILATSLDNIGAIFHPAPTLLNAARIEATGGDFEFYREGITPAVARVMESMDAERLAVARAYGVHGLSARRWLAHAYGAAGSTLYEAIQSNPDYRGISAPSTLNHRYLYEDVPTSLVPMVAFGRLAGVPTPTLEVIIDLACSVMGEDFWLTGRNFRRLGLDGMTPAEIRMWTLDGAAAPAGRAAAERAAAGRQLTG